VVCAADAPVPVERVVLVEVLDADEVVVLAVGAPRELLSAEALDKSSGEQSSAS
jgi:hypothetical protein